MYLDLEPRFPAWLISCCGMGLAVSAAKWSGVAFLTGGKTGDQREVVCGG